MRALIDSFTFGGGFRSHPNRLPGLWGGRRRLTLCGRSGLLLDAVEACGISGREAGIGEAGFSAGGGDSGLQSGPDAEGSGRLDGVFLADYR